MMKFMQLHTFYDQYLQGFYSRKPQMAHSNHKEQISGLLHDGFSAIHMFSPYMKEFDYAPLLCIANCEPLQRRWLIEQGIPDTVKDNWIVEIAKKQVEIFKPDVLYIGYPISPFDSSFVRSLSWKPSLVVGWRAAPVPKGTDWKRFDVMLSHLKVSRNQALELGAGSVEHFFPGFPGFLADAVKMEQKEYDVVFSGQVTPGHNRRNQYLNHIAKTVMGLDGEFSIGYFISSTQPEIMPAGIAMHNHGARWGMDMYRIVKSGRIVINAEIDLAHGEAGNMRLFEATGAGSFLLTEHQKNIRQYFEPGDEIETFTDSKELMDKIYYYLAHPEKREAIARRGQERCLHDYSMRNRAAELDKIIRNHLKRKHERNDPSFLSVIEPSSETMAGREMLDYPDMTVETGDPYDIAYRWGWKNPKYKKLVYACYKTPDFKDNARRFHASPEFGEAVRLLSELGKPPNKKVTVLDFGCGNGIASYALSRAGYNVIGVDSSLGEIAGIEAARKIVGLDGADFEIRPSGNERLDFGDGEFDVVWIREALHHLDDLTGFLTDIRRIVKQDGIVCCLRDVVIWNEDQRRHFYSTHPFYPITKDEGCYYLNEYVSAFEGAGFAIEKILNPLDSVINTYPDPVPECARFDQNAAKNRRTGYDLFSFFARKVESEPEKKENVISDALVMMNRGLNEEALDILEGITADPKAVYARAVTLSRMGRTGEAISALECLGGEIGSIPKAQMLLQELMTMTEGESRKTNNVFHFGKDFYGQVILNPGTLANIAFSEDTWKELLLFHNLLATDEYVAYLDGYYRECLRRFGSNWRYLDMTNLLFAASKTTQPVNYMEIGVRRGRGVCVVSRACSEVNITAFDMWIQHYAGMENPGPDFVQAELAKHGHKGNIEFINGDSHKTVPEYFKTKPDMLFDMITVDGDHTEDGAFDDLRNVIPHLAPGGILIFDDIVHPSHMYLLNVWQKTMKQFTYLAGYEYTEAGYGVAFAIRRK